MINTRSLYQHGIMFLFIRLSTVVATVVLLRSISATLVITAPSTVTESIAGLETREQGPTAWICSALAVDSPWTSYANIRGYLEGGNAEKKDYSNLVLYPVMELFHASESRLCVYLPAEDHCYPPAPSTSQVKTVKQLSKLNYYAIRFWGQASDTRVQYYKQKLTAALTTLSKAANFDLFFVSFFSDHDREVRYDQVTTGQGKSSEPSKINQSQPLTCPRAPGYSYSDTTTQEVGQEYIRTTLNESRLNLSDVVRRLVTGTNIQSLGGCASTALSDAGNAFSFVNGSCKVYEFGKNFCPCARGAFPLYIMVDRLEEFSEYGNARLAKGVTAMVIYTEFPLDGFGLTHSIVTVTNKPPCDRELAVSPDYSGGFVLNNQCFLSELHDFANCNQTCRGQPVDVLVKIVDPYPKQHILSLCGQKIVLKIENSTSNQAYVSHAGFGCYRYQGTKTAGGEDCVVTFEKDTKATTLRMDVSGLRLNSNEGACRDRLIIYDGKTTAVASQKFSGCSGEPMINATEAITIKFHRGLGSEENIGFKLKIRSKNV